jgi:hypothetical protein
MKTDARVEGKGKSMRTCDGKSVWGKCEKQKIDANPDDRRRRAAVLTGAHGAQKEPEENNGEKNGMGEREGADCHAELGKCVMVRVK